MKGLRYVFLALFLLLTTIGCTEKTQVKLQKKNAPNHGR